MSRRFSELDVLEAFLEEFSDCFGRCDTEPYLEVYVEGQSSDLRRKSAEPIALRAGVVPRSPQVFLGSANWDEQRMIDRVQEIVARDHADPYAIGLIDETGSPKKGTHTACVQRQWNGNRGKVDNRVVSVHLGYTVGRLDGFIHCSTVICFFPGVGRTTRSVGGELGSPTMPRTVPNPRSLWLSSNVLFVTAFARRLGRSMSITARAMTFWTASTRWGKPTWRRSPATSMDGLWLPRFSTGPRLRKCEKRAENGGIRDLRRPRPKPARRGTC